MQMNEQAIKDVLAQVLTCVLNEVAAQSAPHSDTKESGPIPVELSAPSRPSQRKGRHRPVQARR